MYVTQRMKAPCKTNKENFLLVGIYINKLRRAS